MGPVHYLESLVNHDKIRFFGGNQGHRKTRCGAPTGSLADQLGASSSQVFREGAGGPKNWGENTPSSFLQLAPTELVSWLVMRGVD